MQLSKDEKHPALILQLPAKQGGQSQVEGDSRQLSSDTILALSKVSENKLSAWNLEISEKWWRKLVSYRLPTGGIVVEVAPGSSPKIGIGLHYLGFEGTIYVIEPDQKAIESIVKQYEILLPKTKIIPIAKLLNDAIPDLPRKGIDALLANHPMDDMVIGKSLSEQDFKELFDSAYINREYNLEIQKNFWRRLND